MCWLFFLSTRWPPLPRFWKPANCFNFLAILSRRRTHFMFYSQKAHGLNRLHSSIFLSMIFTQKHCCSYRGRLTTDWLRLVLGQSLSESPLQLLFRMEKNNNKHFQSTSSCVWHNLMKSFCGPCICNVIFLRAITCSQSCRLHMFSY